MLIGNRYADNKLYRGLRHYDNLPLTSGDLHEYADILQKKNAFIMNNLLGSGILNEPTLSISNTGVSLDTPAILLIDGDIALIQSNNEILSISDIGNTGITNGVLCVVGWYQALTSTSTLREYGGVNNNILENDITDSKLQIQVSTRYQFRWDTVLLDRSLIEMGVPNITFNIPNRDATGELVTGNTRLATNNRVGDMFIAPRPASMDYAVSDLYIIPIIQYDSTGSNFNEVKPIKMLKPEGATGLIKSNIEPTSDVEDGDIWYNTDTKKFKFYIEGVGFVPTASDITLMQYHNTTTITTAQVTPSDIILPIGIESYTEEDILQVIYGGVVLTEELHYEVNNTNNTITLKGFTTEVGDSVTFIVVKLVDSSNSNSIAEEFNNHVNTIGSASSKGHLGLSDTASPSLGVDSGIAVTPKALYDATTIIDSITSKRYKLVVTNGVLSVTEIS